jgi:DeoR/GlpR family transcriptional regulator of sugar metabolism
VLLDSGTTTYAIALALSRSGPQRLSVHTTSLLAAQVLCRVPRTRVRLIGGEVDPNDEATTGPGAREAISGLGVDIAFVGVGGLDPEGRVTDYTRAAAELRGAMLRSAQHGYFVVDHRKFGRSLLGPIDGDAGAAGVLVDRRPPETLRQKLGDRGLRVIAPRAACDSICGFNLHFVSFSPKVTPLREGGRRWPIGHVRRRRAR